LADQRSIQRQESAPSRTRRGVSPRANEDLADFRPISRTGYIRVAPVMAIPEVLRQLDVDPTSVLDAAGLHRDTFEHADNRISIREIGRLFDLCARMTGREHFGVLVGMRFTLSNLGPLGDLIRNSQTVEEALGHLMHHLYWHDRAAAPLLLGQDNQCVLLGYSIYRNSTAGISYVYDTAIAIAYRILQELCGDGWKPVSVQLAHRQPRNISGYRELFHTRVQFNADVSGIVFHTADLRRPISSANPIIRDQLLKSFEQAERLEPLSYRERVQGVLHQVLWSGDLSIEAAARRLCVEERTLRRRLKEEGTTFRQILIETRGEVAVQLLENSELTIASIASILRYDDPTAFSRAFKSWSGVSPARWRKDRQNTQS
jgi:AraC-like DNA-binding protein